MAPVLSIVAPVYNEEALVAELAARCLAGAARLGVPFELIIVDDGSSDATPSKLIELSSKHPELRAVRLFRNFGHIPALSAGLALAEGEAVVIMDGDLQDPPELIPKLYEKWKEGFDVVYGLRTSRGEALPKRAAIAAFYWLLSRITRTRIPAQAGTFSLVDRRVADALNGMTEHNRFFAGLRAWVGGRQSFVSYDRPDRAGGGSRVGLSGLLRLARAGLFSFSNAPLRYASLFSLSCGLILFGIGLWSILIRLFTNLAIPGWATYTTLIGMMGFMQSLVLAVLSEYIAMIFDEVKARPLFMVRDEFRLGRRQPPPARA